MSSSDSESNEWEEHHGFHYFGNWVPKKSHGLGNTLSQSRKVLSGTVNIYGCWMPPRNFGKARENKKSQLGKIGVAIMNPCNIICRPVFHADWGPRLQYGISLNDVEENKVVWNSFFCGLFDHFKMWLNEYGQVVAYADAKFNNGFADESGFLLIKEDVLLRKLLRISVEEWAALIEAGGKSKWTLKYDALAHQSTKPTSPLEILWFYMCKRRHQLPSVSVKMRRSGSHKVTLALKILPRFIAEDIRTFDGNEI